MADELQIVERLYAAAERQARERPATALELTDQLRKDAAPYVWAVEKAFAPGDSRQYAGELRVTATILECAIIFGNHSRHWRLVLEFLRLLRFPNDAALRQRIFE